MFPSRNQGYTMYFEKLKDKNIEEYSKNLELRRVISPSGYSSGLCKNTITFESSNEPK